jgi:hypothetical protein
VGYLVTLQHCGVQSHQRSHEHAQGLSLNPLHLHVPAQAEPTVGCVGPEAFRGLYSLGFRPACHPSLSEIYESWAIALDCDILPLILWKVEEGLEAFELLNTVVFMMFRVLLHLTRDEFGSS